jgi:hypothetical protein
MFGFKPHFEPNVERAGHAGTHEPSGAGGHGSATISPASITPAERGFSTGPAQATPRAPVVTAGEPKARTQAGGSPISLPGDANAQMQAFATHLKPDELASMQKQHDDIYTDGDDRSYIVIKDHVYRIWQSGLEPRVAHVLNPDTHTLTDIVLERGKNDAWQPRLSQGLPGGGPVLSHLPHRTEVENRTLAIDIYHEVKNAYRAGHKSGNKRYVRGDNDKIDASRQRRFHAALALAAIRDRYLHNVKSGKVVPPGDELCIPAANCGDLARIVAKRTIERGGYAEVWQFDDATHGFAVIGHPPRGTATSFRDWKDVWIVDPWANIACPAPQYIDRFIEKMKKWERAGKGILDDAVSPLDPAWINAVIDGSKVRKEAPNWSKPNPWQGYPSDAGSLW